MLQYASRANRNESTLQAPDKYLTENAYEVWFAEKMPQTFDICVLANTLTFTLANGYPLNQYDSVSLRVINRMIVDRDHRNMIDEISHHSSSISQVLYHLARMIEADSKGILTELKALIISEMLFELKNISTEIERLFLLSSLARLNAPQDETLDVHQLKIELNEYSFFTVKPSVLYPNYTYLDQVIPDIKWDSKAYNYTLWLEYMVLTQSTY